MENLQIFKNEEFGQVRVASINNEPWFVGKDVAQVLGYENQNRDIIAHVEEEDRIMLDKTQYENGTEFNYKELGQRGGWIINESGLYSLILSSRLPNAKKFKRWVTSEVLPTIRKHGAYATDDILEQAITNPDFMIGLLTNLKEEKEKRKQLEEKNKELQPKADKYKQFMDTDGTFGFRELCKHLNGLGYSLKETELRTILKDNNIICKQGRKYVVTQEGVREGYGILKDNLVDNKNRPTTRYTEKLRDYLVKKIA